jgi:hypothetical protein
VSEWGFAGFISGWVHDTTRKEKGFKRVKTSSPLESFKKPGAIEHKERFNA